MSARTPFVAGNWKMNLDRGAVRSLCRHLATLAREKPPARLGVFPPFVYLADVVAELSGSGIVVGAQTCHPGESGAYTGEISARMIRDVGASHVIVGHSERRQLCGESDADVRARLDAALAAGLDVILCLGETLAQREAHATASVVTAQLEAGVTGLSSDVVARRLTIAYEPVWAIGTGLNATPAQAQEVHALLRARLAALAGDAAAAAVVVQYGGSVKPDNIAALAACPDVDGALVGGASLDIRSFATIARLGASSPRPARSDR
ncbi:MAG TPA: triose-phosphate isomerase [Planctomycetota bacterium]|nr:triose-phosphate isomerase [Planctomycetota bacterium]